ncbi:MAG: type II secretion system protein [Sedimentisphaerales bacterium]|jgi:prepilin-type N-terminal cleavage/methylation domain-containing protein/prepilin-type processing-associated H-X9-DG protein|nr:type II secretion system protein [Sedimentisphaerales bacterium]HNY79808.1 type II secretion system protein [Sedimentisphaerales bacterium]HOH63145.1 type II secretion system protein [Sedimentisphaerales bacterium]
MGATKRNERERAFTLIELLVVISIIVMLLALLLPVLGRARQTARAAVCLSRLHQSSLAFKMYTDTNEGRWFTAGEKDDGRTGPQNWLGLVASFWANTPGCMACPMATRGWDGHSDYDAFTAWVGPNQSAAAMIRGEPVRGPVSYAFNNHVSCPPRDASASTRKIYWATCDLKGAACVPVLFDCAGEPVHVSAAVGPRSTEAISLKDPRWLMCIDRHNGGINMLFMDWSVRKVGLKELWTLKWYPTYDTAGPWTKAGGMQAEDWPQWMQKYKDY